MEDFKQHLDTIEPHAWEQLFSLIPAIEEARTFGELKGGEPLPDGSYSSHYWSPSEIAIRTIALLSKMGLLVPNFDWGNWEEGKALLRDKDNDYSAIDTLTLCQLLTLIIKADRFNEGFAIARFDDSTMLKILRQLRHRKSQTGG